MALALTVVALTVPTTPAKADCYACGWFSALE